MSIGPLPNASLTSPPTRDQEALRIGAALEHIQAHGNLDGFLAGRSERLALVTTAGKQGLLVWNRSRGRYELTVRGHRHARALRRAGRNALLGRQAGAFRSGMNVVVTAAGAVVVVGALFLAFNPTGPADRTPAHQTGAYFTGRAPASAPVQGIRQESISDPRAVAAAAVIDTKSGSSEQALGMGLSGPPAPTGPNGSVQSGEAARSLAAEIGSEPEIARTAKKSLDDHRDRQETKLTHHKKSARRERNWDNAGEARGPGYAYGSYGGTRRYGQWSPSPWWFR